MFEECTDTNGKIAHEYREAFVAAINDDMDTAKAIATMWDMLKDDTVEATDKRATIIEMDSVFGLGLDVPIDEGKSALGFIDTSNIPDEIQKLLDTREVARIARNWAEADKARDAIELQGYTIEDTPEGPRVSKK